MIFEKCSHVGLLAPLGRLSCIKNKSIDIPTVVEVVGNEGEGMTDGTELSTKDFSDSCV